MELERSGVKVAYSFPGVKVHAKIALIRKLDMDGEQIYSYLSTGNFHEDTSKLYTDFGLFTYDERITSEVARILIFLKLVRYLYKSLKISLWDFSTLDQVFGNLSCRKLRMPNRDFLLLLPLK